MKTYKAISGNTSRTIHGCNTANEALQYAIKCADDCVDHTDNIIILDAETYDVVASEDGLL